MTDIFTAYPVDLDDPASNAAAVTPSDSTDLTQVSRGLWIGVGGNINVDMRGGQTVLYTGVQAGTLLPIRVRRVRSTNTTASNIVAIW